MDKQAARKIIQKRLEAVSSPAYAEHSKAVLEQVGNLLDELLLARDATSTLLYTAVSAWREPPLGTLAHINSGLQFDLVAANKHAAFPTKRYDIIFVPLFGFTKDGYRLGRGGGWYDRFLATQPQAFKIGVGLEAGRIDFRVEPHDIPMDALVTEARYEILRR